MINVVVGKKRTVKVSSNTTAGVLNTTTPVTIKNTTGVTSSSRLDGLLDVDATNESAGATLIYNADQDKYIVKKLDLGDISGALDGGTF